MRLTTAAILLVAVASTAHAEMPIEVRSKADDLVGQRLVYFLKEGIRTSSSLGLSFDEKKFRLQVNIVTLEQNLQNPGYSTVYSMVITWKIPNQPYPLYMDNWVGYCGTVRVKECAESLLADVSQKADEVIRVLMSK